MKAMQPVSLEEYLNTSYEMECEYLDGRVFGRNGGETDHSWPLGRVVGFFASLETQLRTFVFPILRIQMSATRVRVPDVCVYLGKEPKEQVPRTPPFLAVEILSKEDLATDLLEKLADYYAFRIPYVWIIDPQTRSGTTYSLNEPVRTGLHTKAPDINLPVEQLFED
jgi:Uma2 family endonuclease